MQTHTTSKLCIYFKHIGESE